MRSMSIWRRERPAWTRHPGRLPAVAAGLLLVAAGAWLLTPFDIDGWVEGGDGNPVDGASVDLVVNGAVRGTTHSRPDGAFNLPTTHLTRDWRLRVAAGGRVPVTAAHAGLIVLPDLPRVRGQVLDEAGAPLAAVSVMLRHGEEAPVEVLSSAYGDFDLTAGLAPGSYQVHAEAEDHDPYDASIDLTGNSDLDLPVVLRRRLATINLTSDPPGQPVTVDGQAVASCPVTPCSIELYARPHVLAIETDLFEPWRQEVMVATGEHVDLAAGLRRKTGTLHVSAPHDAGAELYIDGRRVPEVDYSAVLPTGQHQVAYRAAAHWPSTSTVSVTWNQITSFEVPARAVEKGDLAGFRAGLGAYLGSLPGSYAVYMRDLAGGHSVAYNENQVMEAASVIKVPLAMYVLHLVDHGQVRLEDQVELRDSDFMGGTGVLFGTARSGDRYSVRDLLALLIQQSDNTAWNALNRVVGRDQVDAYAAALGAPDCHQADATCTAREATILIGKLATSQALSDNSNHLLLNWLETTVFNDRINYYLPGLEVAHKVGMDGGVANDCGIVFHGAASFLITVFTDSDNPDAGYQAIRDIARAAAVLYGS